LSSVFRDGERARAVAATLTAELSQDSQTPSASLLQFTRPLRREFPLSRFVVVLASKRRQSDEMTDRARERARALHPSTSRISLANSLPRSFGPSRCLPAIALFRISIRSIVARSSACRLFTFARQVAFMSAIKASGHPSGRPAFAEERLFLVALAIRSHSLTRAREPLSSRRFEFVIRGQRRARVRARPHESPETRLASRSHRTRAEATINARRPWCLRD